jgi:membrane fusion protein (multidrug efflux system)
MPGQDAIAVRVAPAAVEPVSSLYSTSATLRADKTATVTARTRGVVERLLVEEGDRVAEGQVLVQLEDDEQIIAAERARTARDTTAREYARARTLHEQELLSEEAYETARRTAEDAEQAAALAELTLSRTQVRAPFGGIVLKRHLDVGATVSDGTALYDLADLDPLYADVNVPERHVLQLAPRQPVRLTADSTGQDVEAIIERIAPSVDPTTGTVKVTLAVARAAGLRPGAFVRVDIVIDTHPEALVVPRSALVAEGRRWNLFRLAEEGGTVQALEVALGYEEGDRVEILEVLEGEPLSPGDRVVVLGASALSDGARVEVHEEGGADRVSS